MHNNHSERVAPIRLPMAMTENLYSRSNFEEALFRLRQSRWALQKESGKRLQVASTKEATRLE
jgi:hypothetical protein